jgi:hypothetical protein
MQVRWIFSIFIPASIRSALNSDGHPGASCVRLPNHPSGALKTAEKCRLTLSPRLRRIDRPRKRLNANSSFAERTSDVVVHRRSGKTGDTYRATLEVPLSYFGERGISIETFARAINTPEAWSRPSFRSADERQHHSCAAPLLHSSDRETPKPSQSSNISSPRPDQSHGNLSSQALAAPRLSRLQRNLHRRHPSQECLNSATALVRADSHA